MSEPMAALIYDFLPVLSALDPHHTYTTTPLSGGLVNLTVRVKITPATGDHECAFGDAGSMIAKYAPAYVASIGESAPFSQYRQVIEARALALLSQPSLSAYIQSDVSTPKLIHHDPALYILLMSDLGDVSTLDRWLNSEFTTIEQAESAGRRFGEFFARLGGIAEHVNKGSGLAPPSKFGLDTQTIQAENTVDLPAYFSNPSTHELIRSVAVLSIEPHLITCGLNQAEASSIGKVCLDMHERQQMPGRAKVFGLGDCWPKSLLVGGDRLSVIDWEFAGMIEPLAAHLFLAHRTSSANTKRIIKAYALSMFRAHHEHAPTWNYALEHRVDAWRLFGREIINNVVEIDWWGGDEERKELEMGLLGRIGAEFVRNAESSAEREGVLFGEALEGGKSKGIA